MCTVVTAPNAPAPLRSWSEDGRPLVPTATAWPLPTQLWVSGRLTAAIAFAVAGFIVASGAMSTVRAAMFEIDASAVSLSAWSILTISQPPHLYLAFLIGVPAAALTGLLCGPLAAQVAAR